MPSANVSEAAEELFLSIRDCAFEAYRPEIATDSVPLKSNVNAIGPLDPTKLHRTAITGREQAAIIATCICSQIEISPGKVVPRSFTIEGQRNFIEKGASQDIVASESAGWIPSSNPLNDQFVLSDALCDAIRASFDMNAVRSLEETLHRRGSI